MGAAETARIQDSRIQGFKDVCDNDSDQQQASSMLAASACATCSPGAQPRLESLSA